jgi:hypothetical protein
MSQLHAVQATMSNAKPGLLNALDNSAVSLAECLSVSSGLGPPCSSGVVVLADAVRSPLSDLGSAASVRQLRTRAPSWGEAEAIA